MSLNFILLLTVSILWGGYCAAAGYGFWFMLSVTLTGNVIYILLGGTI